MSALKSPINISLGDRLRYGALGLHEIAALKGVCVGKVRADARKGLLKTFKDGRRRLATGPDGARYLQQGVAP